MKKLFVIGGAAMLFAATGCKKEYTCCYYDETGAEVSVAGQGCVSTGKISKSDKDDLEKEWNTAAALLDWTAECK